MKLTEDMMIELIKAHKDGKTIQYRDSKGRWTDITTNNPCWNFADFEYRIKPYANYRPYRSAHEFTEAQVKHGFWIFAGDEAEFPVCATDMRVMLHVMENTNLISGDHQHVFVKYTDLLDNYLWKDGTPCGIGI